MVASMRAVAYISGMTDRASSSTVDVDAPAPETEDARIARLAWEADRVEEARASVRAGRVVPLEAVEAWADSWDTPNELPKPRAGA